MKNKNKAVVLGANYYIGLSAIRCLGKEGVQVAAVDYSDENSYAFRSKYCSEKLIAPHYKNEPGEFLKFLIDYSKRQEVKPVLIPCADPYVEFIDEFFDELKEYYLFPQTEKGLYTKLMSKDTLMQLAEKYGVRIPETVQLDEENYIEKVEQIIKYPCIVKPVDSPSFVAIFRRKIFKVHNRHELIEAIDKASKAGLKVMIQRIIPGFDDHMYTFDAYMNQNSEVTHWTTCQKLRQYPINFGASVYTTQRYVPELYDIGAKFFKDVGYKGFAEIEFKKDAENGNFYLIEINIRITNFNVLLNKVGINIPYLTYQELTGQDIGTKAVTENTGVTFWYAFEDFFAVKDYLRQKQLNLFQIASSFFRKKACAIWDPEDQAPFHYYNKLLMKKVEKKIKRK